MDKNLFRWDITPSLQGFQQFQQATGELLDELGKIKIPDIKAEARKRSREDVQRKRKELRKHGGKR